MPIARTVFFTVLALATGNVVAAAHKTPPASRSSVTLNQGEVARWPGIAAQSCLLAGEKYPAVDSVCYYPFDLEAKPGRYAIAAVDQDGKLHHAGAIVGKVERPITIKTRLGTQEGSWL